MISTLLHYVLSMCLLNTCSMLLVNCFIYVRIKQQPTLTNIYSFWFHHMSYFRYANNIFHSIPVIAPAKDNDDDDIQLYKQLHLLLWCVVILRFKCRWLHISGNYRIEHELKTIVKLHFNGVGLGNAGIACWKTFKLYVT